MVVNRERLYRILNPESTKCPHKIFTSRKRAKRLNKQGRAAIDTVRRTVMYIANTKVAGAAH